ncbi:MAG TPA: nucleotide exchange factor GrpE [Gemmatimonadales bacterium]
MTDKRRFGSDFRTKRDPIHTPGGMTDQEGLSAEGADLASTDMSAEPSSREEDTQAVFSQGAGVPVEPEREAVRRLESQLEDARDRQLRLAAEFDNYRKRVNRERAEQSGRAQASLVTRLLDVLDDMDRLNSESTAASAEVMREAVTLVDRKLRKELEAAGLERIDPAGQPFDPTLHEAVSTIPPPRPELDHTVSATLQTGYRFKDHLVRPARVQVYSAPGQA